MTKPADKSLLKNRKVVEEINRHLWIESEKQGRDIGFDQAAKDWLENFSKAWMSYHMPKQKAPKLSSSKSSASKSTRSKSTSSSKTKVK